MGECAQVAKATRLLCTHYLAVAPTRGRDAAKDLRETRPCKVIHCVCMAECPAVMVLLQASRCLQRRCLAEAQML